METEVMCEKTATMQLPKGWTTAELSEVCTKIQDGSHFSPKEQFSEPGKGRYMYITSKNIRNSYMDLSDLVYVNKEYFDTIYPRCKPELNDVLLTKDGANTGNVTLNTVDEPYALLSSVCLFKPDRSKVLPEYLMYYIQSPDGFKQLTGKMTGTAIKRIVLEKIRVAPFPLAPLPEQRRIVSAIETQLGRLDAAVARLHAAKAKLKRYKQAVLKAAFSEGDSTSGSTWKLQTIGDIAARIVVGYVGPMTQFIVEHDGVPLLSTTHIGENEFLDKEPRQITRSFHAKNKKSQVVPGDILIARHGDSGKSCIVPDFMAEAQVSNAVILSVDRRQVLPQYVCYRINFERTVMQESRVGGVLQVVNTKSMEKFPIRVPSLKEQAKIIEAIDRLLASTEAMESTLDAQLLQSTRLRQAVLKRAFEGRLV